MVIFLWLKSDFGSLIDVKITKNYLSICSDSVPFCVSSEMSA